MIANTKRKRLQRFLNRHYGQSWLAIHLTTVKSSRSSSRRQRRHDDLRCWDGSAVSAAADRVADGRCWLLADHFIDRDSAVVLQVLRRVLLRTSVDSEDMQIRPTAQSLCSSDGVWSVSVLLCRTVKHAVAMICAVRTPASEGDNVGDCESDTVACTPNCCYRQHWNG